jgi:hypothetical protein
MWAQTMADKVDAQLSERTQTGEFILEQIPALTLRCGP